MSGTELVFGASEAGLTPYYEDEAVTIYHGDARELMPSMPANALVVSDPPYNIGYRYESWADNLDPAEYADMTRATMRAPSVLIHLPRSMYEVAGALGILPEKVVAWVYYAHVGDSYRSIAWFGKKPDLSLERGEYRNPEDRRIVALQERNGRGPRIRDWWLVQQVKNVSEEKQPEHHCQIPLSLMRTILTVTPHAGPILDPFVGTGTILRAAKDLGRRAIGIEIEERYCEIAARRMGQEVLAL